MVSMENKRRNKFESYVILLLRKDAGFSSDFFSYRQSRKKPFKYDSTNRNDVFEMKEILDESKIHPNFKRVVSYILGYDYNFSAIIEEIKRDFCFMELKIKKNINIIYLSFERFIFIFEFSSVVLWGFEEDDEKIIIKTISKNCKNIKSKNLPYLLFYVKKGENFEIFSNSKIIIESNDIMEKMAITYSMGQVIFYLKQSSILRFYESQVDITIENTKNIPLEMRDNGIINLSIKEISKKVGLIFLNRSQVNLHSDILDTPDLFWDYDDIEGYYNKMRNLLDINRRIEILNKRMIILKDLYDVLNNEITTQNKLGLVWIVVYLIVVEIFISLFWKILVKDLIGLF